MAKLDAEKQHKIMTESPVFTLVLKLSIPTVFAQLITVIYNTADTWFVSHIDTSASGAVGIVFSVMIAIQAFGICVCMGCQNLISIRLGEKENNEADKIAISGFITSILIGTLFGTFGLIFLEKIMRLIGSTETMLPYCCSYGKWIFLSAPVLCGSLVLNAVIRAEGEPNKAMVGITAGGILNIILDPIFISKLNMGIEGAGIATAISQTVSFILLLLPFISGRSIVKLKLRNISRSFSTYKAIVLTGSPSLFRQTMGTVASILLNRQASIYGDAAVAAITIASKLYMFIRNIILGVGQAYLPVAGYNYGARLPKRTKQSFTSASILGTIICLIFAVPMFLFPAEIIGAFRDDPEVIEKGAYALRLMAAVMPVLAYSTFINHFYQCLGFRIRATFLACLRQGILFIPLLYILTYNIGYKGIQGVQALSDLLTFIISVPFQIYIFTHILNEKNFKKD